MVLISQICVIQLEADSGLLLTVSTTSWLRWDSTAQFSHRIGAIFSQILHCIYSGCEALGIVASIEAATLICVLV